jgi:O-methyltransferase involved in polyketide biosynthesis
MKDSLNIQNNVPTLIMTECLLCYLKNEDSDIILKWCNEFFAQSPFICLLNFEMIEPFDSFG